MTARMDVLGVSAASLVLNGVVHLYNARPPRACLLSEDARAKAVPCAPGCNAYVVYTPRAVKGAFSILSEIGNAARLNSVGNLFKISAPFKGWVPEFQLGCLVIDSSPAFIRPFVPDEEWRGLRRAGTLLLRGPENVEAIFEWWPALREANEKAAAAGRPGPVTIHQSATGKTWFIRSPFRKTEAPSRGSWTLIPAGHCFGCGRPGHVEQNCPVRKANCALLLRSFTEFQLLSPPMPR